MTEPFGLGRFGDLVLDQPGLVGVAEVVEVRPGQDRRDVLGGLARVSRTSRQGIRVGQRGLGRKL